MRRKAIFPSIRAVLWAILICFFTLTFRVEASESDLLFSEIMYDVEGSDSGHEWVEIYNSGLEELVATSTWRFFDGTNHNLSLHYGTSTIASQEFFVLADNAVNFLADYPSYNGTIFDTVLSLPNSSSTIGLSFDSGNSQAVQANYDCSWGGAGNGKTLEKIILSQDSSGSNWQESNISGGTPGMINSDGQDQDPPAGDLPPEEEIEINFWEQIIISEFLPNPVGADDNEWIEIYNPGTESVDLAGFGLSDNTSRIFILNVEDFPQLNLSAGEYLVVYKNISGLSLNNSGGDSVELYDPNGNLLENVSYSDSALEDRSYSRENNIFYWSKIATPGQTNQISRNQKPVAQISVMADSFFAGDKLNFSAENSYDPENDDLDFQWNFGDGNTSTKEQIKHGYSNPGTYQVVLRVTDSEGADSEANYNLVINPLTTGAESLDQNSASSTEKTVALIIDFDSEDLIISEFIPNPVGSDEQEWIELYNASNKKIDLFGWQIDDADGGSKPYVFSTSTIEQNSFLLVSKADSRLSLNNSSDSVRLLTPTGELWQEVIYEKIPEGQSYAWDFINQEWFVAQPSPGEINLFVSELEIVKTELAASQTIYAIYEIKDLEKNNSVLVQGIVLNKPDKNTKSVYLADWSGEAVDFSQILEVYSYYKNFPELNVGDLVTVDGEISKLDELPRLKIKSTEQIVTSGANFVFDKPELISADDIEQEMAGQFITVKGVVVKKSGKNIYLASDLEEEPQLRVYTNFPLGELEIKKGLELIASGILSSTDSGFKLTPLALNDISVSQEVLGEKIEGELSENIELTSSSNEVLSNQRKNTIQKVLIFSLAGLILVFVSYLVRKKYHRA